MGEDCLRNKWFSLQELISFKLEGLPTTIAGLRLRAKKTPNLIRKKLRGKGIELHFDALPYPAQKALREKFGLPEPTSLIPAPKAVRRLVFDKAAPIVPRESSPLALANKIKETKRRMEIIRPIIFCRQEGEKVEPVLKEIIYKTGISRRTLLRWVAIHEKVGFTGLAREIRKDKNKPRVLINKKWDAAMRAAGVDEETLKALVEEFRREVRGLWAQGAPSIRQVCLLARAALNKKTEPILGLDASLQVCEWTGLVAIAKSERRFKKIAVYERDAKTFYDKHTTPIQRTRQLLEPGEIVFGDVSPCDIPVMREDGQLAWARLIVWQDAATNWLHVTGYLAPKGSGVRREHIALSFAQMAAESPFGLPQKLYLDNGSEYSWDEMFYAWRELVKVTHGYFKGRIEVKDKEAGRVFRSIPFKPRAKSLEGQFSNLLHYFAWHPNFAGSDRLRKKVATLGKGAAPTTLDDLKLFMTQALAFYHATPQDGHLGGVSPAQKMREFLEKGFVPYLVDPLALSMAFAIHGKRRITAGRVKAGNIWYYDKDLHNFEGEMVDIKWPRHEPDICYVCRGDDVLSVALAAPIYEFADPAGAKAAQKLAKDARVSVSLLKGQVAWLEPRDLMGEIARIAKIDTVVDDSHIVARHVLLNDKQEELLEKRKAALQALVDERFEEKHKERRALRRFNRWNGEGVYDTDPETARVMREWGEL